MLSLSPRHYLSTIKESDGSFISGCVVVVVAMVQANGIYT